LIRLETVSRPRRRDRDHIPENYELITLSTLVTGVQAKASKPRPVVFEAKATIFVL